MNVGPIAIFFSLDTPAVVRLSVLLYVTGHSTSDVLKDISHVTEADIPVVVYLLSRLDPAEALSPAPSFP